MYVLATRTGLSASDNDIFKVDGEGKEATLSLLKGFNESESYTVSF